MKAVKVRSVKLPVGIAAGRVAMPLTEACVKVGSGPRRASSQCGMRALRSKACESSCRVVSGRAFLCIRR